MSALHYLLHCILMCVLIACGNRLHVRVGVGWWCGVAYAGGNPQEIISTKIQKQPCALITPSHSLSEALYAVFSCEAGVYTNPA